MRRNSIGKDTQVKLGNVSTVAILIGDFRRGSRPFGANPSGARKVRSRGSIERTTRAPPLDIQLAPPKKTKKTQKKTTKIDTVAGNGRLRETGSIEKTI